MAAIPAMVVVVSAMVVISTMAAVSRAAMTIVRTAAIVPIPFVTPPIAATIVVTIAIPADHDSRLHIDRSRLIDDRRWRWCVVRLRRHIDRSRNTDVDAHPHLGMGQAGYRREAQTGNTSQDPDAFYLVHVKARLWPSLFRWKRI